MSMAERVKREYVWSGEKFVGRTSGLMEGTPRDLTPQLQTVEHGGLLVEVSLAPVPGLHLIPPEEWGNFMRLVEECDRIIRPERWEEQEDESPA